jgi:hypothetical protein
LLYDERPQHARQNDILPGTESDFFRPDTYPPLAALIFAPFTVLPFVLAGMVWGLCTLAALAACVLTIANRSGPASPLRDRRFLWTAALGFPAVWSLVMHGQSTILVVLGFALAWLALDVRSSRYWAGFALGLLALKPQFGVVFAIIAIARREWKMVAGTLTAIAIQIALTIVIFGADILRIYAATAIAVMRTAHIPEIKPYLQHSLRALTSLLPLEADAILLLLLGGIVAWIVADIWRSTANWRIRMGALVIGSLLVNPHVYAYDTTVLVLAGLWLGDAVGRDARWFWQRAYWITVTVFFPTALVIKLQLSVLLMLELLAQIWIRMRAGELEPAIDGRHLTGPAENANVS